MTEEPSDLSDDLVAYSRKVQSTRSFVRGAGIWRRCDVEHCPDWIAVYDKLAAAGGPMPGQPVWEPYGARRLR